MQSLKPIHLISASVAALIIIASFPAHAIKIVSGGVGEAGEAIIERVEDRYNLKVIFTGNRGMYITDVAVSIADKNGKALAAGNTSGPILLAQLEPGSYSITASKEGVEKKRHIRLDDDLRTYHITFPVKDEPVTEPMVITPISQQKTLPQSRTVGERVENLPDKK